MKYYLERLEKEIIQNVSEYLKIVPDELSLEKANPKFGADLALPCFSIAKNLHKSPQDIAIELAEKLNHEALKKVEATGGYLNIWLEAGAVANGLADDLTKSEIYGETNEGDGKTVIVDYIGLNLSKPFSVGHLRPTIQGAALINLYRALGYKVVGDSHLGDWGTPFGMWAVAYEKWGSEEALENDGIYELGRLYTKFRKEADEDESLIDEAKVWLKKLEAGDGQAIKYKERFGKISLEHMNTVLA